MAEIAPFRGIRFDPDAVGDLSHVVSPPYDVIGDADRDALEDASPYNVVRLILGRDEPGDDERSNKYTRARSLLEAWRAAGVLREDDDESLTIYEQRYTIGGEQRVQRGVLAAVRLDEPDTGGVLPHERTYADIVDDRLALLRATATNLDCIFCVYEGRDSSAHDALDLACAEEPLATLRTPDGIEHRAWRLTDPAAIATVAAAVEKAQVVIADGHHRHRTAQRYQQERRAADGPGPWDYTVMFLVDASRFGPSLLPIHRVLEGPRAEDAIARLSASFTIEEVPSGDPEALAARVALARIAQSRESGRVFGMLDATRAWLLASADPAAERKAMPADRSPAWRDLDVSVLHEVVFDRLLGGVTPRFVHSASEAAAEVTAGRATLAFLLAPMPFEAVQAVAEAGDAMPQKSTYFIPKPATGIVLRALD